MPYKNPEDAKAWGIAYRAKQPSVIKERKRTYYVKNRERLISQSSENSRRKFQERHLRMYGSIDFEAITLLTGLQVQAIKTLMTRFRAPTLSPNCFWLWHRASTTAKNELRKRKHLDYLKSRRILDLEGERVRKRAEYEKHRLRINAYNAARNRRLMATDLNFRLRSQLSHRINEALKRVSNRKSARTSELIGCTIEELKAHLERQFQPGMSWENYGKWHVDHIKPCVSFDLTNPEQQRLCFNWRNLQPLWGADNIRKSSWYEGVRHRRPRHINTPTRGNQRGLFDCALLPAPG